MLIVPMTGFKYLMEVAQVLVTLPENCVVPENLVTPDQLEIDCFSHGDPTHLVPILGLISRLN